MTSTVFIPGTTIKSSWLNDVNKATYTDLPLLESAVANVKLNGAIGNGVADDTAAIQRAIDSVTAKGGIVYFPAGTYRITSSLVVNTGSYTTGVILYGSGRNSIITQVGSGQDGVKFSTTAFMQNSGFKDLQIVCSAVSGHCVNIVYGCANCTFDNLELSQNSPTKSCVYADFSTSGGGIFDSKFRGGSWYNAPNSTVPGFKVLANGTIFNENCFENLRCYQAKTVQFFWIETTGTPSIWLVNNSWKNINFEICNGGGFRFDSAKNWTIQNVSFWDSITPYTNHLIKMVAGVGIESASNTFMNVTRNGDSLTTGIQDIRIESGQDTVMVNCYTQADAGPSYDFGNKRVTVIGRMYNIASRDQANIILPELVSVPAVATTDVFGETLHIGGRTTAESTRFTYGSGFVQVTPMQANTGIILNATDASLAQAKSIFIPTALYPLPDNTISLGLPNAHYTTVFATTAAINTSDERSKDQISDIDPVVLRAWGKVSFCQFKFRDAVEMKSDGARWHFGVIAQRVKEAFESEGLDAFAYGLLCYDEWEDSAAKVDENGEVIIPAVVAGNRYGIRYEEALVLECAYLRSKLPK